MGFLPWAFERVLDADVLCWVLEGSEAFSMGGYIRVFVSPPLHPDGLPLPPPLSSACSLWGGWFYGFSAPDVRTFTLGGRI